MSTMTRRGHRGAAAAILIVGGGAVAFVWAGHATDVGQLLRGGGDERQRALDRDATAITGIVLTLTAVVWAIVSLARTGDPGVPGSFCAIAGITYGVALGVLRRRR